MLREHKTIASACAKEGGDHLAFLLRLCERELIDREQRAAERRIRAAKFPMVKTLDTFDFKAQPSINKPLILDLMRGEYMERNENVLLMGNSGTGKSHIVTALGHAACGQGKHVRFLSVTTLVTQLLEAREERQLERLFKRIEKQHLLILDEFGYVPFSKAGAELLLEVLSRAYERQSVLMTTTFPASNGLRSSATNDSPARCSIGSPIASTSSRPMAKATVFETQRNARNGENKKNQ
jgi:DNA replication protein DnaC